MDSFVIQGGRRLTGRMQIEGAKNAALPILAATLLTDEPVILQNVPEHSDIRNMLGLLQSVGSETTMGGGEIKTHVTDSSRSVGQYDIVKTMRASISTLGPLLAKRGVAVISMPGGCSFGDRPIDLHLRGMEALGAKIAMRNGYITATCDRLQGATIFLGGPFGSTVLGTANVMSAAVLARGITTIESAACEPEIVDLATMLNGMGARIRGAGGPRITIEGVDQLGSVTHRIMPDRIIAGTYAIAAAITNGDVILDEFPWDSLLAAMDRLRTIGVHIHRVTPDPDPRCCTVQVTSERRLRATQITTQPHPGFATDLQAQFMALLCMAEGNSIINEKIYPERFLHVAELGRMGARITRHGSVCVVEGTGQLVGARVMASDLRASACLVLAGLAAQGETVVDRVYHLDRGYFKMEETLQRLGASIERVDAKEIPSDPNFELSATEIAAGAGTVIKQSPDC
ncbi:MAG: UDP-N-acetylglucosamine 1-carboxyvinyltransferase [Planctomycetota bacterium]|nr:UDP-N-acetylglucosamine 1-carboxyvinyltransferase [Planctomycetota bacterium]